MTDIKEETTSYLSCGEFLCHAIRICLRTEWICKLSSLPYFGKYWYALPNCRTHKNQKKAEAKIAGLWRCQRWAPPSYGCLWLSWGGSVY